MQEMLSVISTFISTIGFPIAACILMGWYINDQRGDYEKLIERMEDKNNEKIEKLTEALNNNTKVMEEIRNAGRNKD